MVNPRHWHLCFMSSIRNILTILLRWKIRSSIYTDMIDRSSISEKSEATPNSYGAALRAALREDPDVILVGEMRDLGDDFHRDHGGRDRTSGIFDTAYHWSGQDHRPNHRCISARPTAADPNPAGSCAGMRCFPAAHS